MDREKAKVEVQKIWLNTLEQIKSFGSKLEVQEGFQPDGMLLFFFGDDAIATIGRGKVDTRAIIEFLALHNPNFIKLGQVRVPDKVTGVV